MNSTKEQPALNKELNAPISSVDNGNLNIIQLAKSSQPNFTKLR